MIVDLPKVENVTLHNLAARAALVFDDGPVSVLLVPFFFRFV